MDCAATHYQVLTRGLGKKKERAFEIDVLRGIPIFIVVLYHFCWSFSFMPSFFSNSATILKNNLTLYDFLSFITSILTNRLIHTYFAPLVGGLFIFICGVSSVFSRNNLRRGFLLFLAASIVTLATFLAGEVVHENYLITFGVLHLMAFCVLFYAFFEKLSEELFRKKISPEILALFSFAIFLFSLITLSGYDPFRNTFFEPWPIKVIHDTFFDRYQKEPLTFLTEPIGFVAGDMDWWPIFPYLGVFLLGVANGKWVYEPRGNRTIFPKAKHLRKILSPLCFIGSHTIYIYILHQPIIILVLFFVFLGLGFRI